MSKLSGPMIDALVTAVQYDDGFRLSDHVKPNTRAALETRKLTEGGWLTIDGVKARTENMTLPEAAEQLSAQQWATTQEKVGALIGRPVEKVSSSTGSLTGGRTRPFVVQQYRNGIWSDVPGMSYRTWGTANVKRLQRQSIYSDAICRVLDVTENRVCP